MTKNASARRAPPAASPYSYPALKPIACCVMLALCDPAFANPTGATVVNGAVTFARPDAQSLHVTNSPGSIINWQGFSIGAGELTKFTQQSASSAVLNRVVGGDISRIFGTLSSNGRVFLINPQGIAIGAGGVIDTAGFVGSTLNMLDSDFLAGKLRFDGGGRGILQNAGAIKSAGDIFLVGPSIENSGLITSGGSVVLAAGRSVTITSPRLDGVQFTLQAPSDQVLNLGSIAANDAVGLFAGTLHHSGDIRAANLALDTAGQVVLSAAKEVVVDSRASIAANGARGGAVTIDARNGLLVQDGSITARGTTAGGGRIALSGDVLFQNGEVRADGASGGAVAMNARNLLSSGRVSADGALAAGGNVDLVASSSIIQTSAAKVSADSASTNGGNVRVQAGERLFSSATLTARGAGDSATGGAVQVLGRDIVLRGASLDASGGAGGGSVLVGGDYQGRNAAVPNAKSTDVNFSTKLNADARVSGNGGKVIVWSDERTRFGGQAFARGGARSGDGGFIEVSGKENLLFGGLGNASAAHGKPGTLLLDPKNIIIDAAAGGGAGIIDLVDPHIGANDGFGSSITVLANGNIVAGDPNDSFVAANAGALYLFDGTSGALLSSLTGSHANDAVGSGNIALLPNGNYVVFTPSWGNGVSGRVGAVTWRDATGSPSAPISSANSLVGSSPDDSVGAGYNPLSNGNYVILSPNWSTPTGLPNAGAVTWAPGNAPITGVVSNANSLVGTHANDQIGTFGIIELPNQNYVVASRFWNNNAGSVTWGSGTAPLAGDISSANSLVGGSANDQVGSGGILPLANSNYVVVSPSWNAPGAAPANAVGAVTLAPGNAPLGAFVSSTNSLVGTQAGDNVGGGGVRLLVGNNNFVVNSPSWNNGAATQAGAATWSSGTIGQQTIGAITSANSLVGNHSGDMVSSGDTFTLANGNYIVSSPDWGNGANTQVGAATFGLGATGVSGIVGPGNSLVGSHTGDRVGLRVVPLPNDNYVVGSPDWTSNVFAQAGAATLGSGTVGITGFVSSLNSLIGTQAGDQIGDRIVPLLDASGNFVVASRFWNSNTGSATWSSGTVGSATVGAVSSANSLVGAQAGDLISDGGLATLPNGNYIVFSPNWNNGGTSMGAFTWGPSAGGVRGVVSAANSMVGSTSGDQVGGNGYFLLANGNYVVLSQNWQNGGATQAGAATWAPGNAALTGTVSAANSLVGSSTNDRVGSGGIFALSNGNYLVHSPEWNNGAATQAGALTFGLGTTGVSGVVGPGNSLVGSSTNDRIGANGISTTATGNYVVTSIDWNNTSTGAVHAGAVTFGSKTTGVSGVVSSANSLVGTSSNDLIGSFGTFLLPNGSYVVASPNWNNGAAQQAGAVTWGSPTTGVSGNVSAANSLVGTTSFDNAGSGGVAVLPNGNYVVITSEWNGTATAAGAVTWGSAATGVSGAISTSNSFTGATTADRVGLNGIVPLPSGGNFVVGASSYDNGAVNSGRAVIYAPGGAAGGPLTNPLAFGNNASADITITPSQITSIANAGTAVVLQANNDITLNAGSNIVTSAGGAGGALTMQAGRSITLNSSITTDNGALTLVANDTQPRGVSTADRDDGAGSIAIASGTTLDAGTADINISVANGGGRAGPAATAGDITTGNGANLRGGRVTLRNDGGGNIFLGTGAIQARSAAIANNIAAIDIAAPAVASIVSSAANMSTASGAISILAGNFIDLDRNSLGSVLNAAGNVSITSTGSSIAANGPTPGSAFVEITGAAVTMNANTFINIGEVTGHGVRARTGDVNLIAGTSVGGSAPGAMKGPIVADNGNVNITLLGLGPAANTFLDFGDSILAPHGSITVDNGAGGQVARSINLAGTAPISAGGNITLRSADFMDLGAAVHAGGTMTLDSSNAIVVRSGVAGSVVNMNAADTSFSGGTSAVNGTYTVSGSTRVSGGAVSFSNGTTGGFRGTGGTTTVANGGVFHITGTAPSFVRNNAIFETLGTTTLGGTLTNDATMNVGGAGLLSLDNNATLTNNATLALNGAAAAIAVNAGATLTNSATGTLNLTAGASDTGITGAGTVQNSGILQSLASGIRTLIGTVFNNSGTVDVQNGALRLTGNGSDTGAYRINAGARLEVAGGTRDLNAGASVSGAGAVAVSGATLNVNAPITIENPFELTGASATLGGSGGATLAGSFNWSDGAKLAGAGALTTSGATTVSGVGNAIEKNWLNIGAVSMASGATLQFAAGTPTITNRGSFDLAPTGPLPISVASGTGAIVNEGVFTKSGSGTQTIASAFTNASPGTLNVNAGTLAIPALASNAGLIVLANGATLTTNGAQGILNTGTIAGNGTIDVGAGNSVTNSGVVRPGASPGTLSINGDYVQSPTGTLAIEIGGMRPGVDYDLVNVSGTASLSGTLAVDLVNGFRPTAGDTFAFMRYAHRVGDFSAIVLPQGTSSQPNPMPVLYEVELFGTGPAASTAFSINDSVVRPLNDQFLTLQDENVRMEQEPRRDRSICR